MSESKVNKSTRSGWIDRALWITIGAILTAVIFLLLHDRSRDWTDHHIGAISAAATMVAVAVGIVTVLTLRHALYLAADENERQKDSLRPIVLISPLSYWPGIGNSEPRIVAKDVPTYLDRFGILVENGGVGPALDISVNIVSEAANYVFSMSSGTTPVSLSVGDYRRGAARLDRERPFPTHDSTLEELGANSEDWQFTLYLDPLGTITATYSDVYDRRFCSTTVFRPGIVETGRSIPTIEFAETKIFRIKS